MQPVKLRPIPASEFTEFPQPFKTLLQSNFGVPVNDALLPIWQRDYDILLLFGGRGGGKSEAECDNLLDECLSAEYFKCYYGRKVYDTVRGSCFATLVYCIKKNKLEHLFQFSEAEHSSMIITCKSNGNKFIPFGSDKADKLKSIKDPTHIWCEEFDQFDFKDFEVLYPTLRTLRGANRFCATFNTHEVYPNHWILKIFFPKLYEGTDKDDVQTVDILKGRSIKKVFVNYTDNYFIDQEAYRQNLWISSAGNLTVFEGVANGAFGINLNDSPYAFAFDRRKHVSNPERGVPHPVLNRAHPLLLAFDFNRNPMSCIVSQLYDGHLYVLEAIKLPKSGVEGICTYIKTYYPGCLYIITGDYNGNNESSLFAEQVTHYKLITQYLNLSQGQLKVLPNPKQAKNSTHVNNVLAWFPITIHGVKAAGLVFDLENVKRRADGTILKEDRDKPEQQADLLDCFIGETLVITSEGEKRIDSIKIGERVLTRNGYRDVTDKWSSIAEVWQFEFTDGTQITCTKDHKFYNNDVGYLEICSIFKDNINVWKIASYTTGLYTENTQNRSITTALNRLNGRGEFIQDVYTDKNGLTTLGQSLKVLMCIIKTGMLSITRSATMRLSKKINTQKSTQNRGLKKTLNFLSNFKRRVLNLLPSGTDQKKVKNGTGRTQSTLGLEIKDTAAINYAITVRKALRQKMNIPGSAQTSVSQRGEEKTNQTQKRSIALHAKKNLKRKNTKVEYIAQKSVNQHQTHTGIRVKKAAYKGEQKVYDITVDQDHEFYANGVLVHNCFRYTLNAFLDWFDPLQYAANNQAIEIPVSPQPVSFNVDQRALASIERGSTVDCTKEEYHQSVRNSILNQAGKWIDSNDAVRGVIALNEVKRLDELFK